MDPDGWQAIVATLDSERPGVGEVLAALALTPRLRSDLDRAERRLIDTAREQGASWQDIAAALGLRSRQAAEQRWLRLAGASGRDAAEARKDRVRQRYVDIAAGEEAVALRAAVAALHDRIDRPYAESPFLSLARRTLSAALQADPGALYDLAKLAVDDLAGVPEPMLGRPAAEALDRVRGLLGQISTG